MMTIRKMLTHLRILILSLVFLLTIIKAVGAQTPSNSLPGTLNDQIDSEETLYSIKLLRLKNILRRQEAKDKEALELVRDAEKYAEGGDYLLANIFLEEALKLLEGKNINFDEREGGLIDLEKELKIGAEISRQRFELALESDSALSERSQNPFCSFGLGLNYEFSNKGSLRVENLFRYSQDYLSGEVFSSLTYGSFEIENRFEGVYYRKDSPIKYLQEASAINFRLPLSSRSLMRLKNEFFIRKHEREEELCPDFYRNFLTVGMDYSFPSFRVSLEYQFDQKEHPTFCENDYLAHQFQVVYYSGRGLNRSLFLQSQLQSRDYTGVFSDSSYQNSYWELNILLELRHRFSKRLTAKLENNTTWQRHKVSRAFSPDFILEEIKPSLCFDINRSWALTSGLLFSFKKHSSQNPEDYHEAKKENYYSLGFSLSVDFLSLDGLIFSISDTYELRRFPEAKGKSFSFYSDRNINSLLLYFCWNLARNLELNMIVNYDEDRDVERERNTDTQTSIFSVELSYRF